MPLVLKFKFSGASCVGEIAKNAIRGLVAAAPVSMYITTPAASRKESAFHAVILAALKTVLSFAALIVTVFPARVSPPAV